MCRGYGDEEEMRWFHESKGLRRTCVLARKAVLEAWREVFVERTGNTGKLVLGLPIT